MVFDPPDPPTKTSAKYDCIVIVDPISTGGTIAAEAASRGYPLVAVYDQDLTEDMRSHVPQCASSLQYAAVVQEEAGASIKEAQELIPYVRGVLDALGIKNGPSHGEVMMTQRGPCLVEMNCRAHGGDGAWNPLAMELTGGFTQVNGSVDAYMDATAFAKIPNMPPSPYKAVGQELMLVSFAEGIVKSTPGYEKIKALESFVSLETGIEPGTKVERTVDIFTSVGSVILMHHDAEVLQQDIAAIRQMEIDCRLFEFEPEAVCLGRPS